jgi:parvulin-like peptidyl-prolyl isomerase
MPAFLDAILDAADDAARWLVRHAAITIGGVAAIAAVIVLVLVIGGGDDGQKVPASAVAVVDGAPITKASMSHWQNLYSTSAQATGTKATAQQSRKAAFGLLASATFMQKEAESQHVAVTNAQVAQSVKDLLAQYKGSKQQILQQLGMSEADLRFQQRMTLTVAALEKKKADAVGHVGDDKVAAAYKADPGRWAHPTQRDVRVVLTTTKDQATAAANALKGGKQFSAVAKQYSADAQLAQSGGALKGLKPGTGEPTFEHAIFNAPAGQLVGPVKITTGWMVFKVQKVTPLAAQTLAQASAAIRKDLDATVQGKAIASYLSDVRDRWRSRTTCDAVVRDPEFCKA